jgi:hypothetical protein
MFASPLASCIFVALFYKDMARYSRAREKKRDVTHKQENQSFRKLWLASEQVNNPLLT